MTEVGKISVKAELNTADFDKGTTKVKSNLDEVKAKSKSAENDFDRMGKGLGTLGGKLLAMGTAGVIGLGAIASNAPALAGSMAQIKITTGELARSIGESLAPTIGMLADKYASLAQFIAEHPIITEKAFDVGLITLATGALFKIGGTALRVIDKVKGLKSVFANMGIWGAGAFLSIATATAGWFGSKGMRWLLDKAGLVSATEVSTSSSVKRMIGGVAGGALAGAGAGALIGSVIPVIGTAVGAVAGGIIGGIAGGFETYRYNQNLTDNQKLLNNDYGSPNVHLPPQQNQNQAVDPYSENRRTEELSWEYYN